MRFVYFIKPVGMDGPIKIGCSMSPDNRRSTLENWSPFALEIIAKIQGDFQLEGRFHAYFKDTHQRREWFSPSRKMTETVEAINDRSFDVSILPAFMGISAKVNGKKVPRTDAQCRDLSYSLRLSHMCSRSGHGFPARNYGMIERDDCLMIDYANAYLANPIKYGRPIDAAWARKAAEQFQAGRPRKLSMGRRATYRPAAKQGEAA